MGPSEESIKHCVEAVTLWYMQNRKLPTPVQIYKEHEGYYKNVLEVEGIFTHPDFERGVCFRGIPWRRVAKTGLTTKQMLTLHAVMDPTAKGTLHQRLKGCNTSYSTWQTWLKDPKFRAYYNSMGSSMLEEAVPMMERQLVAAIDKGDLNAVKFGMEVSGRYNPAQQAQQDVKAVLSAVIEIITKHVQDPDTLTRIGFELSALGGGPGQLPSAPTIIQGEIQSGDVYNPIRVTEASDDGLSFRID